MSDFPDKSTGLDDITFPPARWPLSPWQCARAGTMLSSVKLFHTHILTSSAYRYAAALQRRLLELRYTIARTLRRQRLARRMTQQQLAELAGVSRQLISQLEQARAPAALDTAVRALILLGCTDDELAQAFNPGLDAGIRSIRNSAARRFYPRPKPG